MKKKLMVMSFIIGVILNFYGCSEDKIDAKNMEQIYKEEGVPVRVENVTANGFVRSLITMLYLQEWKKHLLMQW